MPYVKPKERACRKCGCTDRDCTQCVEKTGKPCHWLEWDLCSACLDEPEPEVEITEPTKRRRAA